MKPTSPGKKNAEARAVYEKVIEVFFHSGPIHVLDEIIHPEFVGYGTAAHEFFGNREAVKEMAKMQAEQLKSATYTLARKPVLEKFLSDGLAYLILEDFELHLQENDHNLSLRLSAILEKVSDKWVVTHFHGSTPDSDIAEEEAFPMEGLRKKNEELEAKIRERTRELEIETSLERIRARAMAMQSSEELHDVLCVLFQQFDVLGIQPISAFLSLFSSEERTLTYRATGTSGARTQGSQTVEIDSLEVWKELYDKWKTDTSEAVEVIHYPKEILPILFDLFEETFSAMPANERMSPDHFPEGGYTMHGHTRFGYIGYNHTRLPTEEEKEILTKFATEFERVYQRFLDIENAEAQARQAQIEAALERVRTRTMAMHKSEELAETALVLYEQFSLLGNIPDRMSIGIFIEETKEIELWPTDQFGSQLNQRFRGFWKQSAVWTNLYKAWKSGKDSFVADLSGQKLKTWLKFIREELKLFVDDSNIKGRRVQQAAFFSHGMLLFTTNEPVTEEIMQLLIRFAGVFSQTYTRFLDLQKAEAQARQAQIEAALERVRTRTMAMHNTDDIAATVTTFFNEIRGLGLGTTTRSGIGILSQSEKMELWTASVKDKSDVVLHEGLLDMTLHPLLEGVKKAWKDGDSHFTYELSGNDKLVYFRAINKAPEYPIKIDLKKLPEKVCHYSFPFRDGSLFVFSDEHLPDDILDIFKRFAAVFGQTYTRYLDLRKAEVQAWEAQVEAALERVRARSMAMHKTEELQDVINTVYRQFLQLHVEISGGAFIAINSEIDSELVCWGAGGTADYIEKVRLPFMDMPIYTELVERIKMGPGFFTESFSQEEKQLFFKELFRIPPYNKAAEGRKKEVLSRPGGYTRSCVVSPYTSIFIINHHGRPFSEEENDILMRMGKVFEQTYTRFLDLQKAEEQAREAEIQLSIERIRAKTMAMQESTELTEVLSVTFQQLKLLGVETIWTHLTLVHLEENAFTYRMTGRNGERIIAEEKISLEASEHWKHISDAIKSPDKDPDLITRFEVPVEGLDAIWRLFDGIFSKLPEGQKVSPSDFPNGLYTTQAYCKFGFFGLNYTREATEEEADILLRFTTEFSSLYQRFLDLKQAETRAREAQIEAALEKVRSQSLAMHNTSEMQQVANAVFDQLRELGLEMDAVGMSGVIEAKQDYDVWVGGAPFGKALRIPYNEDTKVQRDYNKAIKLRHELFAKTYSGKVKEEYINHLLTHGEFPKALKKKMVTSNAFSTSIAFAKNSGIQIARYTSEPYTTEENELLKRFARVFEQAYIRFMDLEKAEAQARESKIEAALERVRSRSMAMHESREMLDVITVVSDQLRELNLKFDTVSFAKNVREGAFTFWISSRKTPKPLFAVVPPIDSPVLNRVNEAKKRGSTFISDVFTKEESKEWSAHLINNSEIKYYPENVKNYILNAPGFARSSFFLKNIDLYVGNYKAIPYTEEENSIFRRFAQVFEQAYTRFLDLQKAEVQAREAQIEAALERVRAASMAMHQTEDIAAVVVVFFDQLKQLNIPFEQAWINIFHLEEGYLDTWFSPLDGIYPEPTYFKLPSAPWEETAIKSWKSGAPFAYMSLETKVEVDQFLEACDEITDSNYFSHIQKKRRYDRLEFLETRHKYGFISKTSKEKPTKEDEDILQRFAKVFEQTYTRFLDIGKAEEQAREAQIEAALEKVRSRSLAMQKPDELQEVVAVVAEELKKLGVVLDVGGVVLCTYFKDSKDVIHWTASEDPKHPSVPFFLPYFEDTLFDEAWASKLSGEPYFAKDFSYEVKNAWFEKAFEISDYRDLPEDYKKQLLGSESHGLAFAWAENSAIMIPSLEGNLPTAAEKEILIRFAKVFEQAYIRFMDLQKAESLAREAEIEAALERVRSKTMAMHNSRDVGVTVVTLFDEVQKLGLDDSIRCGIGILEDMEKMETWSANATADGEVDLKVGMLNMAIHPLLTGLKKAWESGERGYTYELRGPEVRKYYSVLNQEPEYPFNADLDNLPKNIFHNSFFYSAGILFAFTEKPISEEASKVLERFAGVFGQTYRRYLDLLNAEKQVRESQIEVAMERVRSRAMAMHHTDELTDVLGVLFEQFDFLGINPVLTHLTLFDEENETFTLRIARGGKKQVIAEQLIDVNAVESWKTSFANWKKSELHAIDCIDYSPEMLPAVWEVLHEVMNALPEGQKIYPSDFPDGLYTTQGHCKYGYIGFNHSRRATEEEKEIVIRFAKEFGRLYQRFLDIQKAELQAREALKQATLDRVRGQIASMRSAEDLERITPLVWNELNALGIPFIRCGVFIIEETDRTVQAFLSAPDGHSLGAMKIPFDADKDTAESVAHWKRGEVYMTHWDRKQFLAFMQTMTDLGQVSNQKQYQGAEQPPESLHLHFVPFKQGMMYVGNVEPLEGEQLTLVQSLADAFAIAYARYEDFSRLEKAKERVETTLSELRATQNQLVQSEKMASLGELTAGIAHEIQNPLNFVNNFSEVSVELIGEMQEEIRKGDLEEAMAIMEDIRQNLDKINHHGRRADGIVKGMLQHSRTSSGEKESTDLNVLADEYLRLAYHGLRAKDKSFNATLETHFDKSIGKIQVVPQDMGRVILNLITNAFHVVKEKSSLARTSEGERYEPTVSVSTKKTKEGVEISVKDNGNGIPEAIKEKIFQPFFTTKPTGQGTGLGLSMSYDIVTKGHGGELKVDTKLGEGTTFTITIPEKQAL